ncbi:MAG: cytochrome P450 [Pseudomonadota bacterium]
MSVVSDPPTSAGENCGNENTAYRKAVDGDSSRRMGKLTPTSEPIRHRPRENWRSPFELLSHIKRNQLYVWPARTYRELVFETEFPLRKERLFFLNDPDGLKYVLTRHERFPKSDLQNRLLRKGLGDGLLTAELEHWRTQRRTVQPAFKVALLRKLVPAMSAAIEACVRKLEEVPEGSEIDVHNEMMMLTLDVLCRAMFERVTVDFARMGWAVSEYLETFGRMDLIDYFALPEWLPRKKHWRVRKANNYFDESVADILRQRRADKNPPQDLLQLMLDARDEETGQQLSDKEIRDNLITFFIAGHETTAISLSWSFYLLALHPDVDDKLFSTLSKYSTQHAFDADDLDELSYARWIFEESMRLYPPVPMFDRRAAFDDEISGHKIKKGAHILISPYVLHRHRQLWDRPNAFDPDRFSPEAVKQRHRFQFLPFNAGPRACVGLNFALYEGTLALAQIAKRFRFSLAEGFEPELEAVVTMRPKGGMRMAIHRR